MKFKLMSAFICLGLSAAFAGHVFADDSQKDEQTRTPQSASKADGVTSSKDAAQAPDADQSTQRVDDLVNRPPHWNKF